MEPAPAALPGEDSTTTTSIRLLGARIDCYTVPSLLRAVRLAVQERRSITLMYVNIHCMNVREHDSEYRSTLESADIVYCDGTGVRLGARLAGLAIPVRMTGADWIHDLCRMAVQANLTLFFVGSGPGIARRAANRLVAEYPNLEIAGTASGFGDPSSVVAAIDATHPDIVLVGMGTPTQERWIAAHRSSIDAPVVWAVGALFDFVSGQLPRGPRWMTEHGLEWLCRLAAEPRKLWRRYLIGNPLFLCRVIATYWLHRER